MQVVYEKIICRHTYVCCSLVPRLLPSVLLILYKTGEKKAGEEPARERGYFCCYSIIFMHIQSEIIVFCICLYCTIRPLIGTHVSYFTLTDRNGGPTK